MRVHTPCLLPPPHLKLKDGFLWVCPNSLNAGSSHKVKQRQDKVCTLAQDVVGLTAFERDRKDVVDLT